MISFILILHFHYVSQKTIMVNSKNFFQSKRFLSTLEEKTHACQSLVMHWWNLAKMDIVCHSFQDSIGFGKIVVVEQIFVFKHLEFLLL